MSKRIKFWPQKDRRTVLLELENGPVTVQYEMDLEEAGDALEDLGDARFIVATDWVDQ